MKIPGVGLKKLFRLYWISRVYPGFETAFQGIYVRIPFAFQDARRTGGAVFCWSGTDSDNPTILGDIVQPALKIGKGDIDSSGNMAAAECTRITHVNEHCGFIIKGSFSVSQRDPGNIRVRNIKLTAWLCNSCGWQAQELPDDNDNYDYQPHTDK
jgi:hypothetical protein